MKRSLGHWSSYGRGEQVNIHVDTRAKLGPLELWRHTIGHGGINPHPLSDRVVAGAAALQPRLIRIFVQEFFAVYPDHGRFDWSRLDPYMEALARTGAHLVAAITIKPPPLYPEIDHDQWRPNDVDEWQHVVRSLVHRYSVEREIVTHWEIGNEPDLGEGGGAPYRIPDPVSYAAYYDMTTRAVLEAFPTAKVGGPAIANLLQEPLPGLLRHCAQADVQLDFLSWHLYHSDPSRHGYLTQVARMLTKQVGLNLELMVTEWSCGFPPVSVADEADDARRAALVAAAVLEMRRSGLDGSFYYHLWDQTCNPEDFTPFFSAQGAAFMVRHWNEVPHRFGLFGVDGEVRPQYFVFWMLAHLGDTELRATSDHRAVRVLAGQSAGESAVLAINHSLDWNEDQVATLRFSGLKPGPRRLVVYRIDGTRRWDEATPGMKPIEARTTYVLEDFACQIKLPANSVAMAQLRDIEGDEPKGAK
ncbi:MAG: GH39 family glycosyl hydrolase [Anaerolineae bacterium]